MIILRVYIPSDGKNRKKQRNVKSQNCGFRIPDFM